MAEEEKGSFRSAPPGAYTFLLSNHLYGGKWRVQDIRLYGKSLLEDYQNTHSTLANQWWDDWLGVFDTREEALSAARDVAENHRERHVWWVPGE